MASIDGVLSGLAEARIPVTDRGLLFGDHVFEVARVIDGRVVDGAAHLERLAASARLCRLPPLPSALAAWIGATVAAAAAPSGSLRVMWTRGDGVGLTLDGAARGRCVVTVEPWTPPARTAIRLATVAVDATGRTGALVPAAAKSGSYLASVLALAAAHAADADDALLVDPAGRALETAAASLAIVAGGAVWFARGASLPGVTAARVKRLLAATGVAVADAALTVAQVQAADEVFVTSSRRGVVAVAAVDGVARAPGPTTRRAQEIYDGWVSCGEADPISPPTFAL
ncbi:MAG: aminotransferase class IV [Kofleriaceae bacterium]